MAITSDLYGHLPPILPSRSCWACYYQYFQYLSLQVLPSHRNYERIPETDLVQKESLFPPNADVASHCP